MIDYIELRLLSFGVEQGNKQIVEHKNAITKQRSTLRSEIELDRRLQGITDDFNFCQIFANELQDQDKISSILEEEEPENEGNESNYTPRILLSAYTFNS